jgi:hypothetical protein
MSRALRLVLALAVLAVDIGTIPCVSAADKKLLLEKKLTIDEIPAGTTLKDMLDVLTDLCNAGGRDEIVFATDDKAFEKAGTRKFLDTQVKLGNQVRVPLKEILRQLLTPINATFQVEQGYIVIVPARGK